MRHPGMTASGVVLGEAAVCLPLKHKAVSRCEWNLLRHLPPQPEAEEGKERGAVSLKPSAAEATGIIRHHLTEFSHFGNRISYPPSGASLVAHW